MQTSCPITCIVAVAAVTLSVASAHALAATEVRWGPADDQRAWIDDKTVAVTDTASSSMTKQTGPVRIKGLVDASTVQTKSGTTGSSLPVLRSKPDGGQAQVAIGQVLARCQPEQCAAVLVRLQQAGWTASAHAVQGALVVETAAGASAVEAARQIASIAGVTRADPNFWRPLTRR